MKKSIFCIITFIVLFSGCAATPQPAYTQFESTALPVVPAGMTLDQAIAEAAARIDERIEAGSKIALLNFNSTSERFSYYVLDELSANLLDSSKLTVVDRREIDLIRSEFDFQFSGEVGDDSMQELGRMLGAQSIVSGFLTEIGGSYRIMLRVLNVQNATVVAQYRTDIVNDSRVQALLQGGRTGGATTAQGSRATGSATQTPVVPASGSGQTAQPASPAQTAPSGTSATQTPTAPASSGTASSGGSQTTQQAAPAQQTVQIPTQPAAPVQAQPSVITVEGGSLAAKFFWLETNAANNTVYRIEVSGNETLGPVVLAYPRRRNITIRLTGGEGKGIITLQGNGTLFTVESDVTLILDSGITLKGHERNNASLIGVNSFGTLIMNAGVEISGNRSPSGGGVYVAQNGTFNMSGGMISDNTSSTNGGGVYNWGTFTMSNGEISFNTSYTNGGGVYNYRTFTMSGGEISSNTSSTFGGGVYNDTTFTMSGGEILGNTSNGGGGVFINFNGTFRKTGGTIFGNTGDSNRNRATNGSHAIGGRTTLDTTAGPGVRF